MPIGAIAAEIAVAFIACFVPIRGIDIVGYGPIHKHEYIKTADVVPNKPRVQTVNI